MPLPIRAITPARWIELHTAALSGQTTRSADSNFADDPELRAAAAARIQELAGSAPAPLVVCHSDLHALNLIEQDHALVLLDWEYAHATDPLWDLASWSANNDLPPESQRQLLIDYGQGDRRLCRRLAAASELLLWLYDYVCLLWSQLYLCVRGEGVKAVLERARLLDARLRLAAHYAA